MTLLAAVTLAVSTTTAELGRPVAVTAEASFPAGSEIRLDLARSATDTFAISELRYDQPATSGARAAQRIHFQLLPLAVGRLPVALWWTSGTASFAGDPLVLSVSEPPLPPQAELADIKAPQRAAPLWWPWLAALAASAAAAAAYRRLRRANVSAGVQSAVDPRPPDVVALAELEALQSSGAWAAGRYKEFYHRLTDVLRQYLERRYEVPATRLTTSELARHLKECEVDRVIVLSLRTVFDRADLVKFAKAVPAADWGPRDLESGADLVRRTAPQRRAPEAAAA